MLGAPFSEGALQAALQRPLVLGGPGTSTGTRQGMGILQQGIPAGIPRRPAEEPRHAGSCFGVGREEPGEVMGWVETQCFLEMLSGLGIALSVRIGRGEIEPTQEMTRV